MRRSFNVFAVIAVAMGGCNGCDDDEPLCDAHYVLPVDGAPDAAIPDADLVDAMPDASPPDAMPNLCTSAGDTADHLEPLGGQGGTPQMVVDAFGAAALVGRAGGSRLAFLGADGQRRASDLDLAIDPYAIAFDGLGYVVSEFTGGNTQIRTLSAAGVLGTPTVIGAGWPLYGAIAVHASGDVAVLWRATVDGSLRATVVPAVGSAVETVLDVPPGIVTQQLVGGVNATQSATAKFVAAFADVDPSGSTMTVTARPLAPAGAAVVISTGGATVRQRVQIAPGAVADTFLITWGEATTIHAATYHPVTGVALADRAVLTPAGSFYTRVGGRSGPGVGFEILLDLAVTSTDRGLFLHAFDAAGDPVGTPARIATICTNAYSEENLSFVRNASVRYVTWHDMTLPDNITAAF
jgi:hypothetical protein